MYFVNSLYVMILVTLLYALFASVFTLSKATLGAVSPLFLVGTRMATAGVLMLAFFFLFQKEKVRLTKKQLLQLTLLGVCNIWFVNALEYWGLSYLTSFKTCFIYSLSPFVSALLSYWIFGETLSLRKWGGLLVGCLGFMPILWSKTSLEETLGSLWLFSWPELYVIGAACLSCYGWILLRQLVQEGGVSFLFANGFSMGIGGVLATMHSYFVEEWQPIPVTDMTLFLQGFVALLLISNFLAYNLYGHLLKKYTATFLSFAGFSTPIFSSLFGIVFLQEEPSFSFMFASLVVFVGLFLFNQEELKRGIRLADIPKTA